jgi:hypothetical protein
VNKDRPTTLASSTAEMIAFFCSFSFLLTFFGPFFFSSDSGVRAAAALRCTLRQLVLLACSLPKVSRITTARLAQRTGRDWVEGAKAGASVVFV